VTLKVIAAPPTVPEVVDASPELIAAGGGTIVEAGEVTVPVIVKPTPLEVIVAVPLATTAS
jgi:hypothetical protein